ncbi:4-hydroxyphenylacetate 3-hydroxylase N-terminal domain-containing protein [Streptomyces sp. INA 01156]
MDPQSDRSTQDAPPEAVRIVERRADGIVIRGARLLSTLAPVANEVFVGPYVPRCPARRTTPWSACSRSTRPASRSSAGRPTTVGTASSTPR